jgi:hypothetical protein
LKAILRSAVLVSGLAISVVTGMTAATATPGVVAGAGFATLEDGFGNDAPGHGTADLTGAGLVGTTPIVPGSIHADFTYSEPSATCPAQGTAFGTVSGSLNGGFTWVRVGVVALITVNAEVSGNGVAVFATTSPIGNPCRTSAPVTAVVVAGIAGT